MVLRSTVHILTRSARLAPPLLGAALALAAALPAGEAAAAPLPVEARVRVGGPPRPVALRIEADEQGTRLTARRGGGRIDERLAVPSPEDASVSVVQLAGGAKVAVVRVRGAERRAGALLTAQRGAPTLLWSGRLDPHGDPGERRGARIEVADRTGDGVPDVILGITSEAHRICGQEQTLLFSRAVDPRTLQLRPVVLRRLPEDPDGGEREIAARPESPGPEGPPLLGRALHFVAASSGAGVESDPALTPVPQALADGDPATVWMEGHGGPGRWEFATAHFDASERPIRAIALVPSPSDPELARELGRPRSLWLVGDAGERLHVTLPEDPADRPGERYWIDLGDDPVRWRCVSVVFDEIIAPEGAARGSVRAALAEVALYTDLDYGEGLESLIAELERGGRGASRAAQLLGSLGPEAVPPLLALWERLGPQGRRRAVRVFAAQAREHAEAREALGKAAASEEAEVRQAAIAALGEAGPEARDMLAELAAEPGDGGDAAALALGVMEGTLPRLLELLEVEGAPERPAIRRAIGRAVQRAGERTTEAAAAWLGDGPGASAAAAATLALAGAPGGREAAAGALRETAPRAERFTDRWRLVAAAAKLPADPPVDDWLATLARDADPWMLRAAAVGALAERGAPQAAEAARRALDDDYPRVRRAGVEALADRPEAIEPLAIRARRDVWPMVRAAAARALADDPAARPVMRAAVTDRARKVRAAAIEALTEARAREAWPVVRERLEDEDEWPEVLSAAIAYARTLCVHEAAAPLAKLVDRVFEPKVWAPDMDVAVEAVGALTSLGGERAEQALQRAGADRAPAALRGAVERAAEHADRCE